MKDFITRALKYAQVDNYIIHNKVNEYVANFAADRRYKLKWLASDCYCHGCSSGILEYRGNHYYFNLSGSTLTVENHF